MIVQVAGMHFAFGMKWIISHEKKETRLIKSQFNSRGKFYFCQTNAVSGVEFTDWVWIGFYRLNALASSMPEPKQIHCAALCMAVLVQDAIVCQPLHDGCVWLCVIKAGRPVVGFDLLLGPGEIQSHLDFCQRVFKKSAAQAQTGTQAEQGSFEVIEAFDLLKRLETEKIKNTDITKNIKASRLRALDSKGWSRLRAIALALSAAVALSIISGLALGGGVVAVLSDKIEPPWLQSSSLLGGAVNDVQHWVREEFFPEYEQQEVSRLASLAAQKQEMQSSEIREKALSQLRQKSQQFELNVERFRGQQERMRYKVSAIEFWKAFNQVRQSVPISFKGRQMRHLKCVAAQCDLVWTSGQVGTQNNSTQVDLSLKEVPLETQRVDQFDLFMQSVKEQFVHVPMNWSENSPFEYSLVLGEGTVQSSQKSLLQEGRVKIQGEQWLIAKTGEWSLSLSGETMLVQGDDFVKSLSKWPMELSEVSYQKDESLSFKGRWFYFPKVMDAP